MRPTFTACALACALGSCGSDSGPKAAVAPGGFVEPDKWPKDDHALCKFKQNPELEVSEAKGPGAPRPNIRRVYRNVGDREARRKVLVCRELDTNLDGIKDVVRTFNDKGEVVHEEADTNFDGRIDNWADFSEGRLTKAEADTNFDGNVDVWKFYIDGQLSRVRRATHCGPGKEDVWEIYVKGRLDRIGSDIDCDGHVDRWDRDTERMRKEELARRLQIESELDAGAKPVATDGGKASSPAPSAVKADAGGSRPADASSSDVR